MTDNTRPAASGTRRQFATDDERWRAVLEKDARGDGQFWYAVKTTGVYCRPSCASRRPNRTNVDFYDATRDAEHAGFRACKRCDPNGKGIVARHTEAIATACRLIEQADVAPNLEQVARAVNMSPGHLHRLFKSATGLTPKDYANAHRSGRLKKVLARKRTVTEAIYDAGFNSNGRFYAASPGMLGMTPSAYRNGGAGTTIRFAVGESSLGAILVAASEQGVCAIFLGDDPERLAHDLQDQFPKATIIGADGGFESLVASVVGLVESPEVALNLPLDIRGTVFQQRVWKELQRIPIGETITYAELAKRIGKPKAVRAAAQACGANAIAVAIPCHRVVRTDGELSGYRWGVARKKELLARESAWS